MRKLYFLVWTIVFFSCKKYNETNKNSQQAAIVYMSSYAPIGRFSAVYGDPFMATYFKNDQRQILAYDTTRNNKNLRNLCFRP